MPFTLSTSSPGWQHTAKLARPRVTQAAVGRVGQWGALDPPSSLPPTLGFVCPCPCPVPREDSVGWSCFPKAPRGSPPFPGLAGTLWRSPRKMPPKEPDSLVPAHP